MLLLPGHTWAGLMGMDGGEVDHTPRCTRCGFKIGWTRFIRGKTTCESHGIAHAIAQRIKDGGS
jgi:hypothetical protein